MTGYHRSIWDPLEETAYLDHIFLLYDSSGTHCLKKYLLKEQGDTLYKIRIEHDSSGRVLKEFEGENDVEPYIYVYNEAGLLSEIFHFDPESRDTSRHIYEYDEQGHKIRHQDISANTILVKSWKYDSEGKLTEEKSELKKSPRSTRLLMNEDNTVSETQIITTENDERNYVINYIYNDSAQVIRQTKKDLKDSLVYEYIYSYNKNGDIEQMQFYQNGKKTNISSRYEYDSHGNWTCITSSWSGGFYTREEREIKYYE